MLRIIKYMIKDFAYSVVTTLMLVEQTNFSEEKLCNKIFYVLIFFRARWNSLKNPIVKKLLLTALQIKQKSL